MGHEQCAMALRDEALEEMELPFPKAAKSFVVMAAGLSSEKTSKEAIAFVKGTLEVSF